MSKFIYSFSVILFGLSLGYVVQILVRRELIKLPMHVDNLRKMLQRIALLFLNPVAIIGAICRTFCAFGGGRPRFRGSPNLAVGTAKDWRPLWMRFIY